MSLKAHLKQHNGHQFSTVNEVRGKMAGLPVISALGKQRPAGGQPGLHSRSLSQMNEITVKGICTRLRERSSAWKTTFQRPSRGRISQRSLSNTSLCLQTHFSGVTCSSFFFFDLQCEPPRTESWQINLCLASGQVC